MSSITTAGASSFVEAPACARSEAVRPAAASLANKTDSGHSPSVSPRSSPRSASPAAVAKTGGVRSVHGRASSRLSLELRAVAASRTSLVKKAKTLLPFSGTFLASPLRSGSLQPSPDKSNIHTSDKRSWSQGRSATRQNCSACKPTLDSAGTSNSKDKNVISSISADKNNAGRNQHHAIAVRQKRAVTSARQDGGALEVITPRFQQRRGRRQRIEAPEENLAWYVEHDLMSWFVPSWVWDLKRAMPYLVASLVLLALFCALNAGVLSEFNRSLAALSFLSGIGSLLSTIATVVAGICSAIERHSIDYHISGFRLVITRGVFKKTRGSLSISAAVQVYVERSPLDLILGLRTVRVLVPMSPDNAFSLFPGIRADRAQAFLDFITRETNRQVVLQANLLKLEEEMRMTEEMTEEIESSL